MNSILLFQKMLTEFALLAALTLNADEREVLRDKINDWVKWFMPKLDIESTRSDKCRLVASVDRQQFKNTRNAKGQGLKFSGPAQTSRSYMRSKSILLA